MWFIGLVIGGLVGAAIGELVRWDSAWQLFAAHRRRRGGRAERAKGFSIG